MWALECYSIVTVLIFVLITIFNDNGEGDNFITACTWPATAICLLTILFLSIIFIVFKAVISTVVAIFDNS